MDDEVWDENLYKNWVRGAKGLEFLQEGLRDCVGDKALVSRDQLVQTVTRGSISQCHQCTSQNLLPEHANSRCDRATCVQQNHYSKCFGNRPRGRRKCPNGICSKLYDAIVLDHCYRDPLWRNTDPATWCSDPQGWTFAKCFETTPGPGTSAQETDASGLLSIFINSRSMQNWLACHNMGSNTACPFYESRCIRNDILHKPKMELDDVTLDGYIDTFITVLQDPTCLRTYAGSPDAVNKLTLLKAKQITISQNDVDNILKKREEALSEIEEKKQEAIQEVEEKKQEVIQEIDKSQQEASQEVEIKKQEVIHEVDKKKQEAKQEIDKSQQEAKQSKQEAIQEVEKKKQEAIHEIDKSQQEAKQSKQEANQEVEKKKQEAIQEIDKKKQEAKQEVDKKKHEAKQEIEKNQEEAKQSNHAAIQEVEKKKQEAIQEIDKSQQDAKQSKQEANLEVEKKKQDAIHEVDIMKQDAKQEIEKNQEEAKQSKHAAIHEIEKKKQEAIREIDKSQQEAKQSKQEANLEVEKKKQEAIHEVDKKKQEAKQEVDRKKQEAKQEIEKSQEKAKQSKHAAIQEVDKKKKEALEEIDKSKQEVTTLAGVTAQKLQEKLLYITKAASTDVSGRLTSEVQTPVRSEDQAYDQMKTHLQDDLIEFYRGRHTTIPLSPLIEEATPLLEFYVMPDIKAVKVTRARGGGKEEKTLVAPFRNVFYKENKMCREIYLIADAGLGKTALSKRLALTWCHAKKPSINEKPSQEEIEAMNEFCFVFLLLLRDSSSECDIDDLISKQIIKHLAHTYTLEDLENVMFKETCLVILDGLDEWTDPSDPSKQQLSPIPHRKARKCLTVLTTTRPWKLSVINLHSNQIDQKLEITGLSQKSASMLKKSVISHLFNEKDEWKLEKHVEEFTNAVVKNHISDLEAIPLLLMYLLFLWYENIDLGQSQSELYSQITELLLSRTATKFKNLSPLADDAQGDIPRCFSELKNCKQFYALLKALGKLAFQTLFRETKKENTLVFDNSVAEDYLNEERLNFCLRTGIITQSKVQGQLLKQKSKISFAHKTVQEFFAAVYMYSTPDQTSVPEIVLSKCKCVKDILEMSKILMFISGINVNVSSLISRELMRIINDDEITSEYRSTTEDHRYTHPLKEFQDMCILCCKEFPHENEIGFCLQDVFIDSMCEEEQYRENLKQLTTRNQQNIKSLDINMSAMRDTPYTSTPEVIDYFSLHGLENIEKIHYEGKYNDRDILPLLDRSVKSLYLRCDEGLGSWSPLLFEKVTSLQNLEAIGICGFDMSHSELTLLLDYISDRRCMREIELWGLRCTDHDDSCTEVRLDLTQHSQLRKLTLSYFPLSELNINVLSLEECELRELYNPDLVLRFVNCVSANSKLKTFKCGRLKSSAAFETMLDTLRLSVHVEHVTLRRINLGNRKIPLSSEMVNIEMVELLQVTMSASVFRGLVDSILTLPQTVRVRILHCDITPKREFETEKDKIKASPHFRVLVDIRGHGDRWYNRDEFHFETIKDGD